MQFIGEHLPGEWTAVRQLPGGFLLPEEEMHFETGHLQQIQEQRVLFQRSRFVYPLGGSKKFDKYLTLVKLNGSS